MKISKRNLLALFALLSPMFVSACASVGNVRPVERVVVTGSNVPTETLVDRATGGTAAGHDVEATVKKASRSIEREIAAAERETRRSIERRAAAEHEVEFVPPSTTAAQKPGRVGVIKLYYATDRVWTGSVRQPKWFGPDWNQEKGHLTYGTCEVSIPVAVHKTGEVEKPSIMRLELTENPEKHVIVGNPTHLPKGTFFSALDNEVRQRDHKEIVVFIHGFNNTFDDAASRLAVLDYDLDFDGVPVLYSWSSVGGGLVGVRNYAHDEESVKLTFRPLTDFLASVEQTGRAAGARRISVIAHSMGNRALVAAMQALAARTGDKIYFDEVVMAAPDIPRKGFDEEWPEMRGTSGGPAKRVTLYASSEDRALWSSQVVHRYRRIGEGGPGLLLLPGLDTIDASGCDFSWLSLNHTYFGGQRVLPDLRDLIRKGLSPAQRRLREMKRGDLAYWLIPKMAIR
jgi:esterase/lipase superfamily enzyme